MRGELIPRQAGVAIPRRAERVLGNIVTETRLEHAAIRAITSVGEQALFDLAQMKRTQRELEQMQPDATAELNLIANTVAMAIARSVNRFGSEMG